MLDGSSIGAELIQKHSFIGGVLPFLFIKYLHFTGRSTATSCPTIARVLYYAHEIFTILFEILRLCHVDTTWIAYHIYFPQIIYVITITILAMFLISLFVPHKSSISYASIFTPILYNILIVLGAPECPMSYLIMTLETKLYLQLAPSSPLLQSFYVYLGSISAFYMTGHIPRFTHIQLFSGFVGFEKFHYATAPILIIINMCGPAVMETQIMDEAIEDEGSIGIAGNHAISIMGVLWVIQLAGITTFVATQRENLHFADYMAPKFIFDVVLSLVVLATVTIKAKCSEDVEKHQ